MSLYICTKQTCVHVCSVQKHTHLYRYASISVKMYMLTVMIGRAMLIHDTCVTQHMFLFKPSFGKCVLQHMLNHLLTIYMSMTCSTQACTTRDKWSCVLTIHVSLSPHAWLLFCTYMATVKHIYVQLHGSVQTPCLCVSRLYTNMSMTCK